MKLLLGILFLIIGQALVFFQMQGSLKYTFLQQNKWLVLLCGIPITWLFIEATRYIFEWSGELWPGRHMEEWLTRMKRIASEY